MEVSATTNGSEDNAIDQLPPTTDHNGGETVAFPSCYSALRPACVGRDAEDREGLVSAVDQLNHAESHVSLDTGLGGLTATDQHELLLESSKPVDLLAAIHDPIEHQTVESDGLEIEPSTSQSQSRLTNGDDGYVQQQFPHPDTKLELQGLVEPIKVTCEQPNHEVTQAVATHQGQLAENLMPPELQDAPVLGGTVQAIPGVTTAMAPVMIPDYDTTDEAYAESTSTSYVSSIASEISRGVLENERLYPQYGQHSYGMPVDEAEMDRMDLQHRKYEMVIGDKHFLAPIGPTPHRILDLGTGTGIWALDVADMFPMAEVIGVDIAPIQPRWVAPNCQFEIDDIEADWTYRPGSFDFIHFRDPLYVVRDWPRLMRQIYDHLKPGGWCELACILPIPKCDDGTMPPDSGFKVICDRFIEVSYKFGTPADCPIRFTQYFNESGFVDISEHIFKVPASPWPKDRRLKRIGALEMTNVVAGATAFGLRAFTQILGWTKEQVEVAMIGFRRDVKNRSYHQYCEYFVVYGRKPLF